MSSPPVRHPFVVLMVSFATQKLFNLMSSHLFIFCFVALARGDMFKKNMAKIDVKEFTAHVFFVEFYGFEFYI